MAKKAVKKGGEPKVKIEQIPVITGPLAGCTLELFDYGSRIGLILLPPLEAKGGSPIAEAVKCLEFTRDQKRQVSSILNERFGLSKTHRWVFRSMGMHEIYRITV